MQPCSTEMLCFYENRIYCWGCRLLRCDSVSHVSVWSAAMPLFPFAGRPGITQGKAGRQTQGGEAAKNLTYYREVRLLLFAVTFRLSGLWALFLFLFFWLPFHWKIYFLQPFFYDTNTNCIFFSTHMSNSLSFSLCCLGLCLSLSLSLRHPVLCLLAQRQRVWRHKGMHHKRLCCLLCMRVCVCACVWTLKGIGDLVLS